MTEDHGEALAALHRLVQRNVLSLEEATSAARLITGDPQVPFPPPPRAPRAPEAPPPAAPEAPAPAAEGADASPPG